LKNEVRKMEFLIDVLRTTVWLEIFIIYIAKAIEVSMGTLRIILISKGYKKEGALLSFFEILLWVFIASQVIIGISDQPLKGVAYALGYASGVYFGSIIETKLAFGKIVIQVIAPLESGDKICEILRNDGLGVTKIIGHGKNEIRDILKIYTNRRGHADIIKKIKSIDKHAVISIADISSMSGGYVSSLKSVFK